MCNMHVLITGASSGLGAQLLARFEDRGYHVTGTTHEEETLPDRDRGRFIPYNANDTHAALGLVNTMCGMGIKAKGPVDLLINNAGTNAIRHFEDITLDFMEFIMRINCHSAVMLVRELLAMQRFAENAVVINIISDAAWRPMRHSAAYNLSKAALDMATKQMARELTKPKNLTILGVRPGKMHGTRMSTYIDNEVCSMRGWTPEEAHAYYAANSVTGREANPADVARFIQELYENPLVRTMSGACIDLVG